MPSVGSKEISIATSIGQLNKLAQVQDKIKKTANPKPWLKSAEKVFEKAEHNDVMGDEENAYVFYMRFFNIMQEVTNTTKYQQDKKYYSSLLGKKNMKKAIVRAEQLSASLTKRYKKLESETKEVVENERKMKEKEQSENDAHPNGLNGTSTLKDIDNLLNGKKPSTQTSADIFKKLKVNHSSILSPNVNSPDAEDTLVQTKSPTKMNHVPAIDPNGLYQLLNYADKPNNVLVLDTRSKKDYEICQINYPCCINIPDDLLKTSVTVGSIERKLPRTTWDQWIERGQKRYIVILDQDSKYVDVTADSKVQCLKDAIYLYDTSCTLQAEPLILDGGFEAWLWHYPSLVTNPRLPEVQKILPNKVEQDFSLANLSYPELPVAPKNDPVKTPPDNNQPGTGDPKPSQASGQPHVKLNQSTAGGLPQNQHQFHPTSNQPTGVPNGPNMSTNVPTSTNKSFLGPSNAHEMIPGYPTPGYPTPGYPTPGYPTPGYPAPGYPTPGYPPPGYPTPSTSPQRVPGQVPSMLSRDANNEPMGYSKEPGKTDHHSPTHSNPPGSHARNSIPSPRSQSPVVTQSGTHLNVTSHGNTIGQHPNPSHQPQQLGGPSVSSSPGQLPVSQASSSGASFGQATHNAQPKVASSLPGKGLDTSKSNNQSATTQPPPQSSSVINNKDHPVMRSATNDVHIPAVSMATPPSTQPAGINTAKQPKQVQDSNTTQIAMKPPSSQPPSSAKPPSSQPPSSAKPPSSQPPSSAKPSSSQPPSSQPPSSVINPPSNHPASAVNPQPSVGSKPLTSPTNNSIPTPPTTGAINTPTPVPNKQIPPTVPSGTTSHQFIPQVPQSFTSSHTGMTHGLPPGWERILDRGTGRYYFKDHTTKSTHWNLPASLAQSMNQSIMGQSGMTSTVKEPAAKKPSLKRSLSSPNLAKLDPKELKENLSSERGNRPMVNRRTKPLTEVQLSNLSPVHGAQGMAMTGLRNLGNSCYMNSVLQCLIATTPLVKYILNAYYIDDINKTNPLGTGGRIAEELAVLTRVAHSGNYRHVSPIEFKRTIGRFASHFGGTQQQDSQEFLLFLLDQFHEDTNRVIKKSYIEEKSNDGLPDLMAAQLSWENHKKRNQSIIVELLQGQFKSTLTCSVCKKQSVTFDAFMSLTLPIPTNGSCQIEDCIRLFTTKEKVSRDNKWFCPRCKQHREAWKTMEIWKLPPILIVHFNRFKRDYDGSWLEKRQTNVHFPISNFDISKFVLGPKKSLRSYNLYAVSNHYGSMQSGHYTAFCKNIYDKKWYKFDDSDVTQMSQSTTKSSAAYILCYTSMEFVKP